MITQKVCLPIPTIKEHKIILPAGSVKKPEK
jgi:hypothetical protein